ncbi:PilT-like protein [gamma proteobacterium HdN1]|nr:PilT-like protein [gamma proteobacterium HdN1]
MILVDTSVWIDYLNGVLSPQTDLLDSAIIEGTVALGDIIFLEILQGIKNDKEFEKTKRSLSTLEQHQLLGTDLVSKCAENFRLLRKKGLTIRKTTDVIIATFCIENNLPLLFVDRDFKPFVTHLDLKPVYLRT